MGRLDGRVAFITGAGRGIGAATTLRMAEEGARVALADIDSEVCQQVAHEINLLGLEGLVLPCDVTDSAMVQDAVDQTASHFGRLDILVNNAGVLRDNLLFKMSEDDWDTVLNVHLKGAFLCSRAAQKHMVSRTSKLLIGKGRLAGVYTHASHRTRTIWHYSQRRRSWFHRYRNDTIHRPSPGTRSRRSNSARVENNTCAPCRTAT